MLVSGSRGAKRAARAVAPTIAGMKRHLREAHGISAAALTARAGAQALLKRYKLRAADGMVDRYLAGPGGGAAFGASKNSYWLADGAYHRAIYNEVRFYVENRDRTAGAGGRGQRGGQQRGAVKPLSPSAGAKTFDPRPVWDEEDDGVTGERAAEMFGALAALFTEGGDGSSDDFLASEGEVSEASGGGSSDGGRSGSGEQQRGRGGNVRRGTGRDEGAIVAPQEGAGSRAVAVGIVVVQRGRKRLADGHG